MLDSILKIINMAVSTVAYGIASIGFMIVTAASAVYLYEHQYSLAMLLDTLIGG